ncbi:MAG: phage tail protein [Candidatus Dormibacteria bacterium]
MDELLQAFKFEIKLIRSSFTGDTPPQLGDGAFAECSGLELEADVREYLEGGNNDAISRRVGRVKLVPLVLKRGMFVPSSYGPSSGGTVNGDLWRWLTGMVSGQLPIPRYDGVVTIFDPTGKGSLAQWSFTRGLPLKVVGPSLNAKTGEIAIEELHIAHEGLILEPRQETSGFLSAAQLLPLKDGQGKGTAKRLVPDPDRPIVVVQFNPTSLKIERRNNIDRGGVTTPTQHRQSPSAEAATLTFDLEFDTAEGGEDGNPIDVQTLTKRIWQFVDPPDNKKSRNSSEVPPRVRFLWGTFSFVGIVTNITEDLDYFSPEGMPLRAKLSVSITEQDLDFEDNLSGAGARDASAATDPGGGSTQIGPASLPTTNPVLAAVAQAGESMQQLLSRLDALPEAWRSAMAGLDSPLNLPAGQPVQIGPEAFGGGDIGISSGFAVGADTSMAASLAGALGVDASASVSASVTGSASVAVPGAPAVVVSAGASAEAAAGFALSAGGGVAASLNTVLSGDVTASVAQARGSFDIPGASADVDTRVDLRALSYGRSIPLRAQADMTTLLAASAGGRPNLGARASSGEVPLASGVGAAPWQQLPPSTPDRSTADAQQRRRDAGPDTMRWMPGR